MEAALTELESRLNTAAQHPVRPHDRFIVVAVREAILAAREGNFGVGAVLATVSGEIVERGHNRVFSPHFRSDMHAEMDVMTRFEEMHPSIAGVKGFVLFSSLEPCPMCLTRLINSGVNTVYYAAVDEDGGMVSRMSQMPPEFLELAQGRHFELADCSSELAETAKLVFLSTVKERDRDLLSRASY